MNKDLDPAGPPTTDIHVLPPVIAGQPRRLRVAALFNTTALLATTALIAAFEPKSPPFKGD